MTKWITRAYALVMLIRRLENKRAEMGLTQEQWAEMFGVTQPNWSMVVAGKHRLSSEMLGKIIKQFPGEFDADVLSYLTR